MAIQRGDVFLVNFGRPVERIDPTTRDVVIDPRTGKPETHIKKRPVVVISREQLNRGQYVLIVPFTTVKVEERKKHPSYVLFEKGECGLNSRCVAKTDEIAPYDKRHIDWKKNKMGAVRGNKLTELIRAIRWTIDDPDLSA